MSKLNWVMKVCSIFLLWATAAVALPAQTYTSLFSFDNADGYSPSGGLVRGADGNFYGTTVIGGAYFNSCGGFGCGTIFKITPSGTLTTLYSFCPGGGGCTDGATPYGGLVQGTDGNFYGTTESGGAYTNACSGGYGCGTVFKITPSGTLTTLHSFDGTDGESPYGGLVRGIDGNFYGTTPYGGAHPGGTVFKITPGGTLTTLYNFCSQSGCADGSGPYAGLVQGTDGNFYGKTIFGGADPSAGTVFKITPSGTLTTLVSLNGGDSDGSTSGLVQGADGNFYGTTLERGTYNDGTVFKITPGGMLTTLYNFCPGGGVCTDGRLPFGTLIQGTDGNFYGTTLSGGINKFGTAFQITPSGTLTTLHSFGQGTDGENVYAPLVQGTNGIFYGTTYYGGLYGNCIAPCGTVYSISMGLGPFVEADPRAGRMGAKVGILGTDLTGATSVTFNGTTAAFKVRSKTLIVAEVPSGATTGTIQVATPGGSLSSNVPFIVLP